MATIKTGTRSIGPVGTAARTVAGLGLLADVTIGQFTGRGFVPASWILGLVVVPALAVTWQWWRARREPARLDMTGPWGYVLNVALFLVVFVPQWFVPGMSVLWDGGLIFVSASMLLAAVRGYAGCEVLAVSNWLLRRDDQIGCVLFTPIDRGEHRHREARRSH